MPIGYPAQRAQATINCRILPGQSPNDVQATLARVVGDDEVSITPLDIARPSEPSPLASHVIGPIERITAELWPGVPVIPTMSTGATDSLYLRNAGMSVYGVSGIFADIDDNRAHGRDERILQWVTDTGLVAIVCDNNAVEASPSRPCTHGDCALLPLHAHCLFRLGVYLGEFWDLSPLANWLRARGRNRFLLTAPPLRLPGAVGSPVTPVATV